MDYSYNELTMTQHQGSHPRHTDVDEKNRNTEVRGALLLGIPFIIGVKSSNFTAIGQVAIISGTGAEFLLCGCQHVLCNAKLMAQLLMCGLCRFQRIAQISELGALTATI